jgi:hypothetical protein
MYCIVGFAFITLLVFFIQLELKYAQIYQTTKDIPTLFRSIYLWFVPGFRTLRNNSTRTNDSLGVRPKILWIALCLKYVANGQDT